MRAVATVNNPENIDVTIAVTMPIGEWLKLRDTLELAADYWPSGKFRDLIKSAVDKISRQVYVHESDVV